MTAIAQSRRLAAPRELTLHALRQTVEELNHILRELQQQGNEARGVAGGDTVSVAKHLSVAGNRLQDVGPTRSETDAPNVRELRSQALYARDGIHETDKLILARGGVRTVTPAIAPNDLITLAQARKLVADGNTGTSSNGSTTSTLLGWAYPQTVVTLADGVTSNLTLPDATYLRISGPTAPFSLGGFASAEDGRYLIVQNASGQEMTILNEDAATPTTHRIQTGTGSDLIMSGLGVTNFIYSAADARWIVL